MIREDDEQAAMFHLEPRVDEILGEYSLPSIDTEASEGIPSPDQPRFILFERNTPAYDSRTWVTGHESPEEAAEYALGQEEPGDWETVCLWDRETDAVMEPRFSLQWAHR